MGWTAIPYCFAKYGLVPEGVWIRIGNSTVKATREHIRQMIKDNGMGQFISELSSDILPPLNPEGFEVGASRSMGATAQVSTS